MINVVKIGGNVIDNPEALTKFLSDLAKLPGKKILVHGGGKEATRLSKALGIATTMIEGRRVTDRETLDVVTMVYAGLINKNIVAKLQSEGCNALGLSGADAKVIPAQRRSPFPIDYGFVGDIDPSQISIDFISQLLNSGITPVFSAICYDGHDGLLNCNADSIASAIATSLARENPVTLTYCFEKAGVLKDIDDETSIIPIINSDTFSALKKNGIIAEGMVPKIHNALNSAKKGVKEVRICKAENLNTDIGTIIRI